MYLKVYKCFKYRKELKFNYRAKTYAKICSSTLQDIETRFIYYKFRQIGRPSKISVFYLESVGDYGSSCDLVAETNGIYGALINYYSTRSLDK